MTRKRTAEPAIPARGPAHDARRWLLFVHQLPSAPSNLRVKTWRRMQQLGAIAVKQAVYVLPDSAGAREDFEWLKTEIESAGGEASVFAAASVDAWSDQALVDAFRQARQEAYGALADEIDAVARRLETSKPRRAGRAVDINRSLAAFRERAAAIERIDFFGSAGRDRVVAQLKALEEHSAAGTDRSHAVRGRSVDSSAYRGRLWVTRPRPGVDRMSSAWLIRRFIDPDARFDFVADREAAPPDALPFDMFGVELTHRGDHCTFETLCEQFGIDDTAVRRIAAIVHDLDLKDGRFGAPEAASVGAIIDGLQLAHPDDATLLGHGMTLFEALYRAAARDARPAGPRAVARSRRGK